MGSAILSPIKHLDALYIHIPFCRKKCDYCDFFSVAGSSPEVQKNVLRSTLDLLDYSLQELAPDGIDTIYIGGGTPNSLAPDLFAEMLRETARICGVEGLSEWTVEMNPECINREQLSQLESAGVSRISIGIQSFQKSTLEFLNRNASVTHNHKALELLQTEWKQMWSLDLISAVPGQWKEAVLDDIRTAKSYSPHHLSLYTLTIEEGTVLSDKMKLGAFREKRPEESAEILREAWDLLGSFGYDHYEISNFARPGYRSRHNLHYWRMHPYLGVGPGAVSTLPGPEGGGPRRIIVRRELDSGLPDRFSPNDTDRLLETEYLTGYEFMLEYLMMGLRTSPGINLDSFQRIFDRDLRRIIPETIEKGIRQKLLTLEIEKEKDRQALFLSPTEEGMLILDHILVQAAVELEGIESSVNWPLG